MLNTMIENENINFANISTPFLISCSHMLWTWSQERDRNVSKSSIQHYGYTSGYTFYNEVDCSN